MNNLKSLKRPKGNDTIIQGSLGHFHEKCLMFLKNKDIFYAFLFLKNTFFSIYLCGVGTLVISSCSSKVSDYMFLVTKKSEQILLLKKRNLARKVFESTGLKGGRGWITRGSWQKKWESQFDTVQVE